MLGVDRSAQTVNYLLWEEGPLTQISFTVPRGMTVEKACLFSYKMSQADPSMAHLLFLYCLKAL